MPRKINMIISNGNKFFPQIQQQVISSENKVNVIKPNVPLNSGMITRIHNVRPGCGSCGRKAS